jgi:hypothetical protein
MLGEMDVVSGQVSKGVVGGEIPTSSGMLAASNANNVAKATRSFRLRL